MKTVTDLISQLRKRNDCTFTKPEPFDDLIFNGLTLPDDVVEFYKLAGSAVLFPDNIGWNAPKLRQLALYEPKTFESEYESRILTGRLRPDLCWSWFWLGCTNNDAADAIVLDLSPVFKGWIYAVYWPDHAAEDGRGDILVAKSFTEFLNRLAEGEGDWMKNGAFMGHGSPMVTDGEK